MSKLLSKKKYALIVRILADFEEGISTKNVAKLADGPVSKISERLCKLGRKKYATLVNNERWKLNTTI